MKKHKRKYLHQFDSPYGKSDDTGRGKSIHEIAAAMADQKLALLREVMNARWRSEGDGRDEEQNKSET